MNIKSMLPNLKTWFTGYTRQFSSDDPIVQEAMDLKVEHTRRVCEGIVDIGLSLGLSDEDLCIAETSALLHDIGRFDQYKRYRTFSDFESEDHAQIGVKIIQSTGVLKGLDKSMAELIVLLVRYHNLFALPVGENGRSLFFLKLLRDADKVDIWRVVTDYYQNSGRHRNRSIELDLPNTHQIADPVYDALMNGKLVLMSDLKSLADFKLLQMGWVYDLNFPATFQIALERGYLEKIRDSMSKKSVRVEIVYQRARTHVEKNAFPDGSKRVMKGL